MNKHFYKTLIMALCLGGAFCAQGQNDAQPADLRALLDLVEQGKAQEAADARQREAEFNRQRDRQQQLLADGRAQRDRETRRGEQLEAQYNQNEITIADKTQALNDRLGSLKELFGVLVQVAGDTRGIVESSITSAQYPGRGVFLREFAEKMGSSAELATIDEMERLWLELQREMTLTGTVERFTREVSSADGTKAPREVIRVGPFNLISDGKYLSYNAESDTVDELQRQPESHFVATTRDLAAADSGTVGFSLDPTSGVILSALIATPSLQERIEQGGLVGYIIIAVGAFGILLALIRLLDLFLIGSKVKRQLKRSEPSRKNPLGRVLQVYHQDPKIDTESLELKLGEAILREMPRLSFGVTFLKIISVVAPLMGLLGTVTGMIRTFQQITLFGTGDPQVMAGGISMALMTTVLGLVVAIPMVLLHTLVAGSSKRITHILHEQTAGIIAEHMEQNPAVSGQSRGS